MMSPSMRYLVDFPLKGSGNPLLLLLLLLLRRVLLLLLLQCEAGISWVTNGAAPREALNDNCLYILVG